MKTYILATLAIAITVLAVNVICVAISASEFWRGFWCGNLGMLAWNVIIHTWRRK